MNFTVELKQQYIEFGVGWVCEFFKQKILEIY